MRQNPLHYSLMVVPLTMWISIPLCSRVPDLVSYNIMNDFI